MSLSELRQNLRHLGIEQAELLAWSKPELVRLIIDLSGVWVQIAAGVLLWGYYPSVLSFFIAWLLIGGAQHGCGLIAHEGAHHLIFPGRAKLNDFIARWGFAAPTGLPFSTYRSRHLAHHRLVGTVDDTKVLYQREFSGLNMLVEILKSLFGVDYFRQVRDVLFNVTEKSNAYGDRSPDLVRDLVSIVTANSVIFIAFALFDWKLYFICWALPLITTSMLWSKFRSVVEHHPMHGGNVRYDGRKYFMDVEYPTLRSVRARLVERMIFSKINFHFHAEHHLWPNVSYQHLPKIHARMTDEGVWGAGGLELGRSYFGTLRSIWRNK